MSGEDNGPGEKFGRLEDRVTLRAYVALKGLTIKKHEHGCHYLELEQDGATVQQVVEPEGGEWYVKVNAQRPRLPKELRSRVTAVTSHEEHYRSEAPFSKLQPARYVSRSGKARATVHHYHRGNPHMGLVVIDITARSIPALLSTRDRLLFGKAKAIAA